MLDVDSEFRRALIMRVERERGRSEELARETADREILRSAGAQGRLSRGEVAVLVVVAVLAALGYAVRLVG